MPSTAAVIGGGPAGLMAAEVLATAGVQVTVYDRMPSVGRKFLMAGRGGLNLTHSEPLDRFLDRYGAALGWLEPAIRAFPPEALIAWAEGLGQPLFKGSSGRIFPVAMKASPLLRAWLRRLAGLGVTVGVRQRWTGWDADGALRFAEGSIPAPDATILALGGGSWPALGSDGDWMRLFPDDAAPLRPANCGFTVAWSPHVAERFAGHPLKRIAVRFADIVVRGEAMLTADGIEGGAIYALSGPLRDTIEAEGSATIAIDLRPDLDERQLRARLATPRRGQSLSTFLRKYVSLSPVAIGLVQAALHAGGDDLAAAIGALPVRLLAPRPIGRAISSAGGIRRAAVDDGFMLRARKGVFVAGEMLDWEAPTGGYLLQADFSTAVAAARGALRWLESGAGCRLHRPLDQGAEGQGQRRP